MAAATNESRLINQPHLQLTLLVLDKLIVAGPNVGGTVLLTVRALLVKTAEDVQTLGRSTDLYF